MSEIITVGLDLAKNVFVAFGASAIQVHEADASGLGVLHKKLRRDQVLAFFNQLRPEIWAKVGDARSGGGLKLAEAVAEHNPLDDFRQAPLAVEFAPFPLCRHHQLEGHGQSGFSAEASLGPLRAVPDGGE